MIVDRTSPRIHSGYSSKGRITSARFSISSDLLTGSGRHNLLHQLRSTVLASFSSRHGQAIPSVSSANHSSDHLMTLSLTMPPDPVPAMGSEPEAIMIEHRIDQLQATRR